MTLRRLETLRHAQPAPVPRFFPRPAHSSWPVGGTRSYGGPERDFSGMPVHGSAARAVRAATIPSGMTGEFISETQAPPDAGAPRPAPVAPPRDHCATSGRFTAIPSGNVAPTLSSSAFAASFAMNAAFSAAMPCSCSRGVYRQRVSGTFTVNGSPHVHPLLPGTTLHPTTLQEDGNPAGDAYGHRERPGVTGNQYLPDQAGGCTFNGTDAPGLVSSGGPFPSGTSISINLAFEGTLRDTVAGTTLATANWTVIGSAVAP